MKFSELKKRNDALEVQNRMLAALHVERLVAGVGQPKKLRVIRVVDDKRRRAVGPKQYAADEVLAATEQIIRFLVTEGVIKGGELENPMTKEKALVFEMKVIP